MKTETGEPKFLQQSDEAWEKTKQNTEAINYIIGRFEEICGMLNDTAHNNGHMNIFRQQWCS